MPLFDKVKAQAAQVAQKAQEAGKAGQAKLEDVQARRRYDALLRDLGASVFAERTGHADTSTSGEIDRIIGELQAFEAEHGPNVSGSADTPPPSPESTGGVPQSKVFGED